MSGWEAFWSDLVVAAIGALLTVLIAAGGYYLQRWLNGRRALDNIRRAYSTKRALEVRQRVVPSRRQWREKHRRAVLSVMSFRDQVSAEREHVSARSRHQRTLVQIVDACNHFLKYGEADRHTFRSEQALLATKLDALVRTLSP